MENRAKLRFPRTLLSPFSSCRTHKLISDVIYHPRHRHRHRHHHRQHQEPVVPYSSTSIEPLLPPTSSSSSLVRKPTTSPCPSMCRPRCPENFDGMIRESCILSVERWRISPSNDVVRGSRCPPASPVSPLTRYMKLEKKEKEKRKNKKEKKKHSWRRTQKTHSEKEKLQAFSSKFCSYYEDWFSSDDEREEDDDDDTETETESETLFSTSMSFFSQSSSNSSDPDSTASTPVLNRRKPPSVRRREARRKNSHVTSAVPLEEKMKGSFAVVKKSSEPYNDFRTSMVEMIMEKQLFRPKELEQLLQCFLSLNSPHHHRVIFEVFAEICQALFFNFRC